MSYSNLYVLYGMTFKEEKMKRKYIYFQTVDEKKEILLHALHCESL